MEIVVSELERTMAAENPSELIQLFEHRWPTEPWLIAQLAVRLEEIARRNGLTVQTWTEDGLGPEIGCGGRLPSGVTIQLVESPHLVSHRRVKGPALYADAIDVDRLGIEDLLAQALAALGLAASDVESRARPPTENEVESFRRRAKEMNSRAASAETVPKK